jgi:hypothetical protein
METKQITLGTEVMVSDPCYTEPTWCQIKLKNVKPGNYHAFHKEHDAGDWGVRTSMILVVHEEHLIDNLKWKEHSGEVGVDSGQAGIFSYDTYRKDDIVEEIGLGDGDISFFGMSPWKEMTEARDQEPGERWYLSMCSRTLGEQGWGSYSNGIVSRSGFGDGGYPLFTATRYGKVIAMAIDFGVEETPYIDFEWYKEVTV